MIEIDGLTKRYRDKTAIDGLSFVVEPGVVTGFLGPNGAGKLTTPPAPWIRVAAWGQTRLLSPCSRPYVSQILVVISLQAGHFSLVRQSRCRTARS